jgi:hypothetical protein
MQDGFEANVDSARRLVDVLRDAVEHGVRERAKRRMRLLLDAIDGELQQLPTPAKRRAMGRTRRSRSSSGRKRVVHH